MKAIIAILLVLALPFATAIETTDYYGGISHLGLGGSEGNSSSILFDHSTTTDKQQVNNEIITTDLLALSNFFPCTESWVCTDWSSCSNSLKTRTCTKVLECDEYDYQSPALSQSCTVESNPAGGGGGGGGGGSGGAVPPTTGASSQETKIVVNVPANEVQTITFNKEELGITAVEFALTSPTASTSVKVELLADAPKVNGNVDGIVYKYMSISKTGIDDNKLKDGKIVLKFKVDGKWLKDNGLDPKTVQLKRNVNGQWITLATRLVKSGLDNYYYEAETPGFSFFAISAKKLATSTPPKAATKENLESLEATGNAVIKENNAQEPLKDSTPDEKPLAAERQPMNTQVTVFGFTFSYIWAAVILGILLAGILVHGLAKKSSKKELPAKTEEPRKEKGPETQKAAPPEEIKKMPEEKEETRPTAAKVPDEKDDELLEAVEKYIHFCWENNISSEEVRQALLKKGWGHDFVETALNDFNMKVIDGLKEIHEYIEKEIAEHFSEEETRNALLRKGWPKKLVDMAITEIKEGK